MRIFTQWREITPDRYLLLTVPLPSQQANLLNNNEIISRSVVLYPGQHRAEETLKSAESLEVRLRVKRILEQKQGAAITSEQIRQIRGVMVLELIGDGESRNLLKRWAGGPVGALLTMEAAAALKRLEGAAKAKR